MSVDKTIKLTRSNNQLITATSGTDTFTIAFFEVPRASDNVERRFQRVRKPRADVNEAKENPLGPHDFRFTIYGSLTEDNAKDKKKEKKGSGSHFLAIKDDKAFAIRMIGDCKESAFKVKVWVGGVNVLQHTTHGRKSQDYFVVCEQKWVWGKQVGKATARQFRVFRRGRERLSLRYQLRKNNIKKEVEIEITSRRLADPTGSTPPSPKPGDSPTGNYYLPPPPTGMTSDDPDLSATFIPSIMPQPVYHPTPPPSSFDPFSYNNLAPSPQFSVQYPPAYAEDFLADDNCFDPMPYDDTTLEVASLQERPLTPRIHMSGPPSPADPTDVVIPVSSNDSPSSSQPQQISQALISNDSYLYSSDYMSADFMPMPTWLEPFGNGPMPPEAPLHTPTEPGHCSPSPPPISPPPVGDALVLRPPSPVESLRSKPPSAVSRTPVYGQALVTVAAPQPASDQESIHSDPEEDMLPRQMVVGTGGLIEQILCPDKHPEWIDDDTVTLRFKIVDDPRYLPTHLQNLEEPEDTAVGGMCIRGTDPGGNYREVPNPPTGTFRAHAPVVTDPNGLRRDIRSPMELELSGHGHGEPPEPPVDSGEGSMREREEGGRETDDGGEEGDVRDFQKLKEEAENQPRGFMNDIRMKKKRREQRKRGGVGIMAEKREEPKSERSSGWRRFVDALRRVLTLGR